MPLPEVFTPGEFLDVSGQLNRNFEYLYALIMASDGSTGSSLGATTVSGNIRALHERTVQATGTTTTDVKLVVQTFKDITPQIFGLTNVAANGRSNFLAAGSSGGSTSATAESPDARSSKSNIISTATVLGDGKSEVRRAATAGGTATVTAQSNQKISQPGLAGGIATVSGKALNPGAIEALDGATNTGPTTPILYASTAPGSGTTVINAFSITGFGGNVRFNGVMETDPDIVVGSAAMLYYAGHVLYLQTIQNSWYRWFPAVLVHENGDWQTSASPFAPVIAESIEGTDVQIINTPIYASTVWGTDAPPPASLANGQLTAWRFQSDGKITYETGTSGIVIQPNSNNVDRLYYRDHYMWQRNTFKDWYRWDGGPLGGYTHMGNGADLPVPTTPTINISPILDQYVKTAFVVSGTYQSNPASPAAATLQFADNFQQGVQTTTWSGTDISTSVTRTNANLTANSTLSGAASVRSNTSFNTGKRMFEVGCGALTDEFRVGLSNASFVKESVLGGNSFGFAVKPTGLNPQAFIYNGSIVTSLPGQSSPNADRITFAVDLDLKKVWFSTGAMRAANFSWNNDTSANQNPLTGVGGFSFSGTTGPFLITFNEQQADGIANMNTIGPYATGNSLLLNGFVSWDVGIATTWQAFPSTISVTSGAFTFVHPPIASEQFIPGIPSSNIAVRDGINTGIVGVSNPFRVQTPGQVSLGAVQLSNTQVSANSPIGTKVGDVLVQVNGGTFVGTMDVKVGGVTSTQFEITGIGNPRVLVTKAVLAANQSGIPIVISATMTSAVPTTVSLSRSIIVNTEAPTATSVTTSGPTIIASSIPGIAGTQDTWRLVVQTGLAAPFRAERNGGTILSPGAVHELYYINHTLYVSYGDNFANTWSYWNGTTFISITNPKPVITLNTTSFPPVNGDTGIRATLQSAGIPMSGVTWTESSPSFVFEPGTNILKTVGQIPAPAVFKDVLITASVA